MKWVTRLYVHVDRTACPWLIKRFVDPKAEFLFVPVEKIEETVKKEKAIPYDAPGVELGHHDGKCSFDAIVEKYKIKDPAVLELAKIVRAADTDTVEAAPEAAGLEAVMTGLGIVSKDDYETIAKASLVYDAFYTNCKLRLIREKHKTEIEKLDRKERREFLKRKLAE
ncbi:chromate resistance protein [Candidatus Bathyarchaeota archaeon]|nr:chromate resistance protein [Candidatus Bathyarchaeota archaeon]